MNEIENKHRRTVLLMGIALILCILASFTLGRYPVSLSELLGVLGYKLGLPIEPFWTNSVEAAVWNIRLPRVILSVLVGACLAAAGGAYQGVFQNPMASPDILGASAGAGFGAALAILLGASSMGITIGAFAASLLTGLHRQPPRPGGPGSGTGTGRYYGLLPVSVGNFFLKIGGRSQQSAAPDYILAYGQSQWRRLERYRLCAASHALRSDPPAFAALAAECHHHG